MGIWKAVNFESSEILQIVLPISSDTSMVAILDFKMTAVKNENEKFS